MKLIFHSEGIQGYVPSGYPFPTLIDSAGQIVASVFFYMLYQVATNAWSSPKSARVFAQRLLDVFAYFEDNKVSLEKLAVSNITEYREFKLKYGIDGKPCSQATVNLATDIFIAYWIWSVAKGHLIESSPLIRSYKVRTRGLPAFANIKLPTGDYLKRFLDCLRGPEERIATCLAFGAGLRREEIVSLPADIFLPIERMEQGWGAVMLHLDGYHAKTKGASPRTVEIPRRLYGEICHYRDGDRRATRMSRAQEPSETLLVSKYGLAYQPDWLNDAFSRANTLTGLSLHPHLLRHWYATRFLEYETPGRFEGSEAAALQQLQLLLGHVSSLTTEGYTHLALIKSSTKVRGITDYQRKLEEILRM